MLLALPFSRDQRPAWQHGTYFSNQVLPETLSPIALTDEQFDRLGSISEAQELLAIAKAELPNLSQEQCFAYCYRWVLQELGKITLVS
jgi:hypothetical protein